MRVTRRPRVAIVGTGDELAPLGQTPGPGQIRDSNTVYLAAAVARAGGEPHALGIARDRAEELRARLQRGAVRGPHPNFRRRLGRRLRSREADPRGARGYHLLAGADAPGQAPRLRAAGEDAAAGSAGEPRLRSGHLRVVRPPGDPHAAGRGADRAPADSGAARGAIAGARRPPAIRARAALRRRGRASSRIRPAIKARTFCRHCAARPAFSSSRLARG